MPLWWKRNKSAKELTEKERARAENIQVYYIWYEDRFHFGDERDSFPVSVCLSKEEADKELHRRGKPVQSGGDGYEVVGPCKLADERHPEIAREVLKKIDSGKSGPVPIPSEFW